MRTKWLGIFESVQRCAITDSRTVTEKSVRVHHKELIFSVAVREVVTLGAYLAMSVGLGRGAVGGITRLNRSSAVWTHGAAGSWLPWRCWYAY